MKRVLAIETMQESQSNLQEKDSHNILKDDNSSKADPFIFKPIAPELLDWSNETS